MSIITQVKPAPSFTLPPYIHQLPAGLTYHFKRISRRPLVMRVTNADKPRSCNFIVTQLHGGEMVCTCPEFARSYECEHTGAVRLHTHEEISFHERLADCRAAEAHVAITGLRAVFAPRRSSVGVE